MHQRLVWDRSHTHGDERLIETVESQIPDEPPADKGRNKPKVEVGDHEEWSAAHHPEGHRRVLKFSFESTSHQKVSE